jgi:hypothetical protein
MGLGADIVTVVTRLHQQGYLTKPTSIVEIGAQQLNNSFLRDRDGVEKLGKLFGAKTPLSLPAATQAQIVDGGIEDLSRDAPLARQFWEWLGFDYTAIDIDGSPRSIPLDLNYDSVPKWAKRKFDVTTNLGTTEHVANQLNAFKIVHDLTAHNGIMIHSLPAQGFVNHGLVNYNPKFFWMLARSNDYKWVYFNYRGSKDAVDIPSNVIESVIPYDPDIANRNPKVINAGLTVVLQKFRDIEFVAPLDVNNDAKAPNEEVRTRYWTVFGSR